MGVRASGLRRTADDGQPGSPLAGVDREALAIEIDTSLSSARLVRVFEQLQAERGLQRDQGQ